MRMRHRLGLITLVCCAPVLSHPAFAQFSQQGPMLVGTGAVGPASQGYSVSLSADGNTAIVGGWADNGDHLGAAWIWTKRGGVWSQQGPKLVGSGALGQSEQGISVSISGDGNTVIVGGPGDNNDTGAAWIWVRNGAVWTQQSKLVGSGAIGPAIQGVSVSLSSDGNTAIVGGPGDNAHGSIGVLGDGAAWVWTRTGGVWTQQSKLIGSGAAGRDWQGYSVSLSADGNTAIVGGPNGTSGVGAAWVWTRSAGIWTQQGTKLVDSGTIGSTNQGDSVSLSADGNTAIIGGFDGNAGIGAGWIWTRSGAVWTLQGPKLVGSGSEGRYNDQGKSVSISADGNTAMVGGYLDNSGIGAVWVWTKSGGVWTQQGPKLVGSGVVGESHQGYSVSLSADGSTAIVGGEFDNDGAGAAWVWNRNGETWSQESIKLIGSGAEGPVFQGFGVSMSTDGKTAIFGGIHDNSTEGATWIWTRNGEAWTQQGNKLVGSGAAGTGYQGSSVSLSADGNTAIVGGPADNSYLGATWIWTRSGGVWTQQSVKLVGSGATPIAYQGFSVSLSADGNTAIIGGPYDHNYVGAAWVWTRTGGVWTQQGPKLVGSGAVDGPAQQGYSVSLSADGNTAVVGGIFDDGNVGAVWIWTRNDGLWTQQGSKLVGSGAYGISLQGTSVSLSADGNTVIVGGAYDDGNAGAAWVWTRNGGAWTQQGSKLVGSGAVGNAEQGSSVSLSSDGNVAIIGGPADNRNAGATWAWTRNGGVWYQQSNKLVGLEASPNAGQGRSVSVSGDGKTAIIGGPGQDHDAGAAWIFASRPVPQRRHATKP
jgi:hypothetical protein